MSSANVLTSTAPDESSLYPQLQPELRLQKINEISAVLGTVDWLFSKTLADN